MKANLISVVAVTAAVAVSGCATNAVDLEQQQALSRHYVPVQAHQINDMTLSCDQLTANINDISEAVSTLDKQIEYQEHSSNSFSFISALASVSGTYAPNLGAARLANAEGSLANAGAQIESNQSVSTKELRAMYENRHDVLMQMFYGKNCPAN
jgi:peptidoglycan hydrolase CwlO-like protein